MIAVESLIILPDILIYILPPSDNLHTIYCHPEVYIKFIN